MEPPPQIVSPRGMGHDNCHVLADAQVQEIYLELRRAGVVRWVFSALLLLLCCLVLRGHGSYVDDGFGVHWTLRELLLNEGTDSIPMFHVWRVPCRSCQYASC